MKQQHKTKTTIRSRRSQDMAERIMRPYRIQQGTADPVGTGTLRIVPLGGQNGIGEKNMIVLEYADDAIVLDCGFDLGVDLPGVNYAVPVIDYLQSIKHKLRGYVISHGHMDHIGALTHVIPQVPAPVYGSRFTIGMVRGLFEKAGLVVPQCLVMDMDQHETVRLGVFEVELIRVTHSIPESSAIVVTTPVGKVVNTGDFRLDPEPLDAMPTDLARLRQLGDEGVLLLMSESTNTTKPGRTPTEHTLTGSFDDAIGGANGRVFVAVFSSNMNRIQMIIDAAHRHGRKVALDGRSMMAAAELAVRLGNLKIPKGTLVAMRDTTRIADRHLVVVCTGGQGEPGAAMSRMAAGEHATLKLKPTDTVIVSSTPIPGNERSYQRIADDLSALGVTQLRHTTHEIDGCGPLHVSGHAYRDEHADMIRMIRPRLMMPIYGGALNRQYHRDIALETGIAASQIVMVANGTILEIDHRANLRQVGCATSGSVLIDGAGRQVSESVVRAKLQRLAA